MGVIWKVSLAVALLACLFAVWSQLFGGEQWTLPQKYFEEHNWGVSASDESTQQVADDVKVTQVTITFNDDVIEDLKSRIARVVVVQSFEKSNFRYGFHSDTLLKALNLWAHKYDWHKQEKVLNTYDHFKTEIEGLRVLFVHVKPPNTNTKPVLPILLIHGWPGSFLEFYRSIPFLINTDEEFVFELIIPSIPGFAFSQNSNVPGFDLIHCARIFAKLMTRLGHSHFYLQAGSVGSFVGKAMAMMYPERILGYHTNHALSGFSMSTFTKFALGTLFPKYIYGNSEMELKLANNSTFDTLRFYLSQTDIGIHENLEFLKPDTLGLALSDSPSALVAFVFEKLALGTNRDAENMEDGQLGDKFYDEDLISNVMLYWITHTITTSLRVLKDSYPNIISNRHFLSAPIPRSVPCGIAVYPNDKHRFPKALLDSTYLNIAHYVILHDGGHYAAFEKPTHFALDLTAFVKKILIT